MPQAPLDAPHFGPNFQLLDGTGDKWKKKIFWCCTGFNFGTRVTIFFDISKWSEIVPIYSYKRYPSILMNNRRYFSSIWKSSKTSGKWGGGGVRWLRFKCYPVGAGTSWKASTLSAGCVSRWWIFTSPIQSGDSEPPPAPPSLPLPCSF